MEVLDVKNKCLLRKWHFKLLTEQSVWQELIHNKYPEKLFISGYCKTDGLTLLKRVDESER